MFEESLLVTQLKTTGYSVSLATEDSIDSSAFVGSLPKIFVGHKEIKPITKSFDDYLASGFLCVDTKELLVTEIQIFVKRKDLVTVRTKITEAYKDWSPFPYDSNFSSLIFLHGQVITKTNEVILWSELVGLLFPKFS